eukprot:CAMPEP_0173261026 /NCGR_PEP_ID=MMETSP1142-20121109/25923_1 /TAXON_ID=483371 /ORGANISM="non described non described, Strain CCMP2298" /LENGTH=71 /DNA_ID=CAMNT_0014195873 /DNA_START=183 /DNA_END=396 /DNA_ORIENTATION=-
MAAGLCRATTPIAPMPDSAMDWLSAGALARSPAAGAWLALAAPACRTTRILGSCTASDCSVPSARSAKYTL